MKILFCLAVCLMSFSCATVSEYNQGCRDGLGAVNEKYLYGFESKEARNMFCNELDNKHQAQERMERAHP